MLIIVGLALILFPVTLIVIALVYSREWLPRAVQAVARLLGLRGAR